MSELHEFINKRTNNYRGISTRKLYGLEAFYLGEKPFIVITAEELVAIKVMDSHIISEIKSQQGSEWKLDGKLMENWYLLPKKFNTKKNKIIPILDMAKEALLNPPKKKNKKHKKKKQAKNISSQTSTKVTANPTFFEKIKKILK